MILILFYLCLSLTIIGWVWLLTEAFKESLLWGILALAPPLALLFGVWHIRRQWKPTLFMVVPMLVIFAVMPLFGK